MDGTLRPEELHRYGVTKKRDEWQIKAIKLRDLVLQRNFQEARYVALSHKLEGTETLDLVAAQKSVSED